MKVKIRSKTSYLFFAGLLSCSILLTQGPPLQAAFSRPQKIRIQFTGVKNNDIYNKLKAASILDKRSNKKKLGERNLIKKLAFEKERWLDVLKYYGYYDAEIEYHHRIAGHRVNVSVDINLGPLYQVSDVELLVNGESAPKSVWALLPKLPISARTESILELSEKIVYHYQSKGYPLAQIKQSEFQIDHRARSLKMKLEIDRGEFFTFGNLKFNGLKKTQKAYVHRLLPFRADIPYNQQLVDMGARQLEASGLFHQINIYPDVEKATDRQMPVIVDLVESKPRSIGAGLNVSSHNGSGVILEWENINFSGRGDRLSFNNIISEREKKSALQYTKPGLFKRSTDFRWEGIFHLDQTKAYEEHSWDLGMFLDNRFSERLNYSIGTRLEYVKTSKSEDNSKRYLVNFPIGLFWNNVDNQLAPMSGRRHSFMVTPYTSIHPKNFTFSNQRIYSAWHIPFHKQFSLGFAARLAFIAGSSRREIPPPLRIYGGSPNSLRGYAYHTVSPLSNQNNPMGGRSLLAFSVEPRARIHENFTLTPFFEIGQVFLRPFPDLRHKFLSSAGIGMYFHTLIGPLRFDIAVPLDRRVDIDSHFQLYLSIGSSF